jgi:hypothetical protein
MHSLGNLEMKHSTLALSLAAAVMTSAAAAQNTPPTYQGDPDTYKLIFEDQNCRRRVTFRQALRLSWRGNAVPLCA